MTMTTIKTKIFHLPALLFLFVLLGTAESMAQYKTPGTLTTSGVNIDFWLRADMVTGEGVALPTPDGRLITSWSDFSGRGKNFAAPNSSAYPRFANSKPMNYNPGITFDTQASRLICKSNGASVDALPQSNAYSYYLFYVSKQNAASSKFAAVFDFYDAYSYNPSGWLNGKPYFYTNTTPYPYLTDMTKDVSIIGIIRPSTGSGDASTQQQLYIDGVPYGFAGRSLSSGVGTGNNIVGASKNQASGTNYTFLGDIMEVILLQGPANTQLLSDDVQKINSYLAIKYGITLEYGVSYVNSSGTVIWANDNTTIDYNTGVFGMARDDGFSLYQRQATSSERKVMTVYPQGSTLRPYNRDNTGTLTNGMYLMFGSNGKDGFVAYGKAGQVFANYTLPTDETNHKQNISYKVALTGAASQTVDMQLHIAASYVMVSTDPIFETTGTTYLYPVTNGVAKNIVLSNNVYVGFLSSNAAPGGVTGNLRLWLNASDSTSVSRVGGANDVQQWIDHLDAGKFWTYNTSASSSGNYGLNRRPLYIEHAIEMNFHPAVDFRPTFLSGNDQSGATVSYLSQGGQPVMNQNNPPKYTFVVSLYSRFNNEVESSVQAGYIMGFGTYDYVPTGDGSYNIRRPAFGVAKNPTTKEGLGRYYEATSGQLHINGDGDLFHSNSTTIAMYDIATTSSTNRSVTFGFDGHSVVGSRDATLSNVAISHLNTYGYLNEKSVLGGGSKRARNFDGLMGEVIAYERLLDDASTTGNIGERNRLYSYLSLKYATTLDINGNGFDYSFSDGNYIWKGATNPANALFHNRVTALIRDDVSNQNNMQARSTVDGAIVHMGIGKKLGTSPDLTGFENDLQAIVWGDDGMDITNVVMLSSDTICGDVTQRTSRMWMVEKTGDEEVEVILEAYGASFPYNRGEVYLLVSSSQSNLNKSIWEEIVPMTYDPVENKQRVNYTFPEGITYFMFGLKGSASSCVGCEGNSKKEVTYTDWDNGVRTGFYNFDAGGDDNLRATINVEPSSLMFSSTYPRKINVSGKGTLRVYKKGSSDDAVTTTIKFTKTDGSTVSAATAQFYIYDVDYNSGAYDRVEVIGYCDGYPVYPELDPGRGTRSYEINKNVLKAKKLTSNYAATRGRVAVIFDAPVEEIRIIYTSSGSRGQWIGIGPLTLGCGKQKPEPPPLNTDGMSFSKEAYPRDAYTCEKIKYTYRIFNSHCEDRAINFTDTLDTNMRWIPNSLELDSANITNRTVIYEYGDKRGMMIDSLQITQGGEFKFSAYAEFVDNAPSGIYYNQADMVYNRIIENVAQDVVLSSKEYWDDTIDSTAVNVTQYFDRLKNIEIDTMYTDKSCFITDSKIKYTIKFYNPNPLSATISTNMSFFFNEEFTYIANSIASPDATLAFSNLVVGTGDEAGSMSVTTTLPPGISTLEFVIKAPSTLEADYVWDDTANDYIIAKDADGNTIYIPAGLEFELSPTNATPHVCEEMIFDDASGIIEVPHCGGGIRKFIITNKRKTMILRQWTAP